MGCDIHMYREKFVDGQWVTADEWVDEYCEGVFDVPFKDRFTDRNYNLFGLLANGVMAEYKFSFAHRGIPFSASKQVFDAANGWGEDGHNHSYLYVHELKDMIDFLKTEKITISGMKDKKELAALNESVASGSPNWDLLWPYCKWASDSFNYEQFSIDVPASLMIGDALDRIVSSFSGVSGDNHRIVFWFDN